MFGLGWAEIMIVGVVALVVIGPKELPLVFRKVGQMVGKAKGMAREFSSAMNDAADQAGMKDAMDGVNSIQDTVRTVSDPTTKWKDFVPGSETAKLAEERAEKAKAMHDDLAGKAQERLDAVKAANAAAEGYVAPKDAKAASAKTAGDAAPTKKAPAKKPAAKKPAVKKAPAKKPAAKKPAAKKPAAKKPAAKT